MLQSISPINKVYQTAGSSPVKVLCSDANEYVCKYVRSRPAYHLFNEYLAASFLKIWNLKVPDFDIIMIKAGHFPEDWSTANLHPAFFSAPCFGSRHICYGKEIDPGFAVLGGSLKIAKKIANPGDLLAIALFDLWMANEDRNHNNYNLLLDTDPVYAFVPIDHERCFNSNSLSLKRPLVVLTEDETLLNSDLAQWIFAKQKGLRHQIDVLLRNYYLWVVECQKSLESTVNAMPEQWGIAKSEKIALLNQSLFQPEWLAECEATFRRYTTKFLLL
jgi:hypothetical protein